MVRFIVIIRLVYLNYTYFFVKRLILNILLVFFMLPIVAQNRSALFEEAYNQFDIGNYDKAYSQFVELLAKDSLNCNLNYLVGNCLFNLPGRKRESLTYFEKAIAKYSERYREGVFTEKNSPIESLFYLAQVLMVYNRLDEAKEYYLKFRSMLDPLDVTSVDYVDHLIASCDNATVAQKKTVNYRVNKTFAANFQHPVFKAVFNSSEDLVFFRSQIIDRYAIFTSSKINDTWTEPKDITDQLSVDEMFNIASVSADGKRLYFAKIDSKESALYQATFDGENWSKCVKMPKPINSNYDQTFASESVDGSKLFITSNRKGTLGGLDIFVSKRETNGNWSNPINLGKVINTPFNEEAPFLASDNATLYFCSQGHYNIGGYDVFVSTQKDEKTWTEPQNLGIPFSTTDDDLAFVPSINSGVAYIADYSSKNSSIVEIDTREIKDKMFYIKGNLALSDEATAVEKANVLLLNGNGDTLQALTPSIKGYYQFDVKSGSYSINFSAKGYSSVTKPVLANPESQNNEILVDAILQPLQVASGEFVTIRSLFFDFNSFDLTREDSTLLERISRIMLDYKSLAIEVEAHTDNKGDKLYNMRLSLKRANAVSDFLISRGISKSRIIPIGVGDAIAIARNTNPDGTDNEQGRRFNRRAEIRLINAGIVRVVNEDIDIPEYLRVVDSNEYNICLAETDSTTVMEWPTMIDRSRIQRFIKDGKAYYLYGEPSSKTNALSSLNAVIGSITGAFIIPQKFFQSFTNVGEDENNKFRFAIQVGAFKQNLSNRYCESLGKTEKRVGSDGLIRYLYGDYKTHSAASLKLAEVKQKGFNDAFVVPFSKNTNKRDEISMGYTIQIFASFVHINVSKLGTSLKVKESKGTDGYFRYTVGSFETYKEALNYLKEVKSTEISGAFVRRISEISGY